LRLKRATGLQRGTGEREVTHRRSAVQARKGRKRWGRRDADAPRGSYAKKLDENPSVEQARAVPPQGSRRVWEA